MNGEQIQVCAGHQELALIVGRVEGATKEHTKQLDKVFNLVEEIKTSLDREGIESEIRKKSLERLEFSIKDVDRKIENGLRAAVKDNTKEIKEIKDLLEKREVEEEAEKTKGVQGFLREGWIAFKSRSAYFTVVSLIITGAILFSVIVVKLGSWLILPKLLKLFGISV